MFFQKDRLSLACLVRQPYFPSLLAATLLSSLWPACATRETSTQASDDFARQRALMVDTQLRARDITHGGLLEAMGRLPRHLFIPETLWAHAYADSAVPIGWEQTISQPYVVALMTQAADPEPGHRALEIGTGSGYQAAVLAELVKEVYTIEIIPELAQRARTTLARLGYETVHVRAGDGYRGWPEAAPFDVILVTAAAPEIPGPLLDQLADRGRLVMPVGRVDGVQTLTLVTRRGDRYQRRQITGVRFVPLTGEAQQPN